MATFKQLLVNSVLTRYRTDITNLTTLWRFQESTTGNSCTQYKVNMYNLVVVLTTEVNSDDSEGILTWSEIVTKWDLETKRIVFLSYGINLNLIFTDVGLPTIT